MGTVIRRGTVSTISDPDEDGEGMENSGSLAQCEARMILCTGNKVTF